MKTGFKDPTAIKKQSPKDHPVDGKKTPWDFTCPQYDERSSCYVNTGTHYGIGHRQPVASEMYSSAGGVPTGRVNTLRVDEAG